MASSNVLVVGHPRPEGLDIGAHFAPGFAEAREYLSRHRPAVLVFGRGSSKNGEFDRFCQFALESVPESLWIVATEKLRPSELIHWTNSGRLHDLIDGFEDPELESKLQSALEASGEEDQRRQLVVLFEDQSSRLKRLKSELESRVQKRHKSLRKSLRTLEATKTRMEAFHSALLGINRASTVLQMEQSLNEALRGAIEIEWVRVRFESQSSLKKQTGTNILSVDLPLQFEKSRGEVMFAKADGKRFSSEEVDFLQELSEALALALSRLHKLEQAETLKGQWQATFDAIPHPLCLAANDFEILKLNAAFQAACPEHSFRSLIGKNCFQIFFGKEFQPPAHLESPFTFRNIRGADTYEVQGQRLGLTHDNQTVQLILMRSVTEEARFERRILEASKLAELGTIGSSIAHELNNPLGGILSFLQLILMDMKKTDPLHADIKAMEAASLRCRDIVQNLLSFSRKQDLSDSVDIDLWEVAATAVRLIELQSKSLGLRIVFNPGEPALVRASPNALSQALCNVLQNAMDAIADRRKGEPQFEGLIEIRLETGPGKFLLKISDNGTGIRPEVLSQIFNPHFTTRDPRTYSGMGLTTAYTIVSEHGGSLEILSQTGNPGPRGTQAIIALPRLDHSLD